MSPELNDLLIRFNRLDHTDRLLLWKLVQIADGQHVVLGEKTGTMFGTASTQKIGFLGKTPIVQPGEPSVANSQGGTYSQTDVQSIATLANNLRTILHNYGLTA